MASDESAMFLTGVIEGFYGKPWALSERLELFDLMAADELTTYLYAPKDDLKHRALWRECYTESERGMLGEVIRACLQRGIEFVYAIGPGLDLRYSDEADAECLQDRFEQLLAMGCRHFALLFDDIPDRIEPADLKRWGSLASAQCHLANVTFEWVRERVADARFLFCPTPYCGRMKDARLGGTDYLSTVGRELSAGVDVFWTGPEIISREITVAHIRELTELLGRPPIIWDNLHANDYDGRRFYCGPYAGRPPELRSEVRGILVNPNNEWPLNRVPLRTFAQYLRCDRTWDARKAYLGAMNEWHDHFETVGAPVSIEDLILFGDCYYLPYENGPLAEAFCRDAERLFSDDVAGTHTGACGFLETTTRLRDFCARMAELRDRSLFHAVGPRVWELREELDLLIGYVQSRQDEEDRSRSYHSHAHLHGTYRGGVVPRLQRLLTQRADGSFDYRKGTLS